MVLQYKTVDTDSLKEYPHNVTTFAPFNVEYSRDALFAESVAQFGVRDPIQVTRTSVIISGHRRWCAAKVNKLGEVPILVDTELTDPEEIEILWHDLNLTREMSNEERGRFFMVGLEVAKKRKGRPEGRHADIVAADLGVSRRTAEMSVEVIKAIDEAEDGGHVEEASGLRKTMNTKGVRTARKAMYAPRGDVVDSNNNKVPQKLRAAFKARAKFKKLDDRLQALVNDIVLLSEDESGAGVLIEPSNVKQEARKLFATFSWCAPHHVCGCRARGCKLCGHSGWLPITTKG